MKTQSNLTKGKEEYYCQACKRFVNHKTFNHNYSTNDALASYKKKLKREIGKMKKEHGNFCSKDHNFHTILDDILSLIEKLGGLSHKK